MKLLFSSLLLATLFLASCGSASEESTVNTAVSSGEATTKKVYLRDNRSTLDIPPGFVKSSRSKLSADVPSLRGKNTKQIESMLLGLEFDDKLMDVFVDTSKTMHFFVVQKTDPMTLDKEDGMLINSKLADWMRTVNDDAGKEVLTSMGSDLKKSPSMSYYKYRFTATEGNKKRYVTTYFLTGRVKTYLIAEFSDDEEQELEESYRTLSNGS